ncbi:unnamed protein product [Arctogadus glacialis]
MSTATPVKSPLSLCSLQPKCQDDPRITPPHDLHCQRSDTPAPLATTPKPPCLERREVSGQRSKEGPFRRQPRGQFYIDAHHCVERLGPGHLGADCTALNTPSGWLLGRSDRDVGHSNEWSKYTISTLFYV